MEVGSLKELFETNKNIVINTDIDGILSGLILVKSLGCKIVGFTNSKQYVWLNEENDDLYANVYVDMFVTDDRAICVDQHIVALDEEHQRKIHRTGTKYSPQIEGEKAFNSIDYSNKYPFGAVHYIIAKLESEGIEVELPPLDTPIPGYNLKFGDLILRADDAMASTVYHYVQNARNWWNWLKSIAPNSENIENLIAYCNNVRQSILLDLNADGLRHTEVQKKKALETGVGKIKGLTKKFFNEQFNCRTSDGGFSQILNENGDLLPNIKEYIDTIASLIGLTNLELPEHFITHEGIYHRSSWLPYFHDELLNSFSFQGHKVFSYAFIYSPSDIGEINFSFTLDMQ